ncbi:MAG: hypothetical protein WDO74_13780 [Pseudomonadota bacterium]
MGLKIAVHDADRMRFRYGVDGLQQIADGFTHGQRATPFDLVLQVSAVQQLHHHVWHSLVE